MATREITQTERIARANSGPGGNGNGRGHIGSGTEKLAQALGWFSIGLGVIEIVAPRALAKFIGIPAARAGTTRLMGLREVAAGAGILARPHPTEWVWARVGGDILDVAALTKARKSRRSKTGRVAAAMAAVAGVTALDVICAKQLTSTGNGMSAAGAGDLSASAIVNRTPEECYRYWHDIEKFPAFIEHLRSVRVIGERRSHWITKGPAGKNFAWDAEVIEDVPNQRISWRSLEGSDISNSGSVEFEPVRGGKGTIVRVRMCYEAPRTLAGSVVAQFFGKYPGLQVRKDLLRFKQLIETGEIATTEGQPAGRRSSTTRLDQMVRI